MKECMNKPFYHKGFFFFFLVEKCKSFVTKSSKITKIGFFVRSNLKEGL